MAEFGAVSRAWLTTRRCAGSGPHKGAVHLALASLTNACFDLWAKARGIPLWRLLLDLKPAQVVALLDLSYVEDVLSADEASVSLWIACRPREREDMLRAGYPGYDTSVGWFQYQDERVRDNARTGACRRLPRL